MNAKKTYWNYVRNCRGVIVALTLLASLESLFLVAFAYVSKLLVDSITDSSHTRLIVLAVVLGALILLEVGLKLSLNMLYARASLRLENKIRKKTLLSYIENDYLTLDSRDSGKWLNRILSDSKVVSGAVITYLPNLISLVTRIVASFIALLLIDVYFALALLGLGVLSYFLTIGLRKKSKALHKNAQQEEDANLGFYKNTVYHSSLLKFFHSEERTEKRCAEIQEKYYVARKRYADFSTFISTGFLFLMRLSYLGAIIYASLLIARDASGITYGALIAMIQLIAQIEAPFTSLSGLLPHYYAALASIERIGEFVPMEEKKETALPAGDHPLIAENIAFSYRDERILFAHLSFTVFPHTVTLFRSPSGSGKTTLIKCLMGMYPPKEGTITYGGKDVRECTSLFAYVPQTNYLIRGTIDENLTLFADGPVSKEEKDAVIRTVCLDGKIASLPRGMDTEISDDGNGLSVGEGQRLSIARALLSHRPILVLDEATSALDRDIEAELIHRLSGLSKTVLFISHRDSAENWADDIVDLRKNPSC